MNGPDLERILHHLPTFARDAENSWARDFARSLLRQSRRSGWRPTGRQLGVARRLVVDLFAHRGDDVELIEHDDD